MRGPCQAGASGRGLQPLRPARPTGGRRRLAALLLGLAAALGGCGHGVGSWTAPEAAQALPAWPSGAPARVEPIPTGGANQPYRMRGRTYPAHARDEPFTQTGTASWYGDRHHGRRTASGERFDRHAFTAAHPTMPLPSYAIVEHLGNGRSVVVRVNDRGPFRPDRIIDLSEAAARRLGVDGLAPVRVRRLTHAEIRAASGPDRPAPPSPSTPPAQAGEPDDGASPLPENRTPLAEDSN